MPSLLGYKAIKMNQHVNDLQLSCFPIRWCFNKKKWMYGNVRSWQIYLLVSFLWKVVIVVPLVSVALQQMLFSYHEFFQIQHIFVALLTLNLVIGSVIFDLVSYLYGEEMVMCCNWCYESENQWMNTLTTKTSQNTTRYMENTKVKGNHCKYIKQL